MKNFVYMILFSTVLIFSCKEAAEIRFDANGGNGTMNPIVCSVGDTVKIPENGFSKEGFAFAEWNTKKDGSGASAKDRSSIRVTQQHTVLYAQWTDVRKISVSDLTADVSAPESVLLTWTLSGSPSAVYRVSYKTGETETVVDLAAAGFDTPEKGVRINGLTAGTEYTFTVTAAFDTLEGTASVKAFPTPQPVTELKAEINENPGEVILSWSPSATAGVTYKIYYGKTAADTVYGDPVSASTLTLTGLDCGSEYRFAVRAVKEGVEGPAAEATAATKKLLKAKFEYDGNSEFKFTLSEFIDFEADSVQTAEIVIVDGNDNDVTNTLFGIENHEIKNKDANGMDEGSYIGGDILTFYSSPTLIAEYDTLEITLTFKDDNYYDSIINWTWNKAGK